MSETVTITFEPLTYSAICQDDSGRVVATAPGFASQEAAKTGITNLERLPYVGTWEIHPEIHVTSRKRPGRAANVES